MMKKKDTNLFEETTDIKKNQIRWQDFFPENLNRHPELRELAKVVNELIEDDRMIAADQVLGVTEFFIFMMEKRKKTFDNVFNAIKIIKRFEYYAIQKNIKYEKAIIKVSAEFNCSFENVERILKTYRILKKKKLPAK